MARIKDHFELRQCPKAPAYGELGAPELTFLSSPNRPEWEGRQFITPEDLHNDDMHWVSNPPKSYGPHLEVRKGDILCRDLSYAKSSANPWMLVTENHFSRTPLFHHPGSWVMRRKADSPVDPLIILSMAQRYVNSASPWSMTNYRRLSTKAILHTKLPEYLEEEVAAVRGALTTLEHLVLLRAKQGKLLNQMGASILNRFGKGEPIKGDANVLGEAVSISQ